MSIFITFPVSRFIGGSVYIPQINKRDDGSEAATTNIGVAIPKNPGEQHWQQTSWGQEIFAEASAYWKNKVNIPGFSWKITDGDSPALDQKGQQINLKAHYAGNWVIWFSQPAASALRVCNRDGSQDLFAKDAIVPGYYIQVYAEIRPNETPDKPSKTPGMYMNPRAIALYQEGERITAAAVVNTQQVGFGQQAVTWVPPAPAQAFTPPVQAFNPVLQSQHVIPGVMNPMHQAFVPPAQAFVPPVQAFTPPVQAFVPPAPPPPPPTHNMTAAAQGWTYEQLIAQGWTDEKLVSMGLMLQ